MINSSEIFFGLSLPKNVYVELTGQWFIYFISFTLFDSHSKTRIFAHLKLWVAAARHNVKWVQINHICLI